MRAGSILRVSVMALAGLAGTAKAQGTMTYQAENGMIATGTAQGFDVLGRAGATEMDYFCAAAAFARHRLGAPENGRVVVTRGLSDSPVTGRRSVGFVVGTGAEQTGGSFLRAGGGIGRSMMVRPATVHCYHSRILDARED
ncbi:hypothetical protein [Tropicimonas sp.]|uniref:hypothetical protein n=1 Tax=Tropicimonas sp. TaxID=2067044 RepID=UPI003A86EB13